MESLLKHVLVGKVKFPGSATFPNIRHGLVIFDHNSLHGLIGEDLWLQKAHLVHQVDVANYRLQLRAFEGMWAVLRSLLECLGR